MNTSYSNENNISPYANIVDSIALVEFRSAIWLSIRVCLILITTTIVYVNESYTSVTYCKV